MASKPKIIILIAQHYFYSGVKPTVKTLQPLSKEEAADVFKRTSQNSEGEDDRIKGVGFRYMYPALMM